MIGATWPMDWLEALSLSAGRLLTACGDGEGAGGQPGSARSRGTGRPQEMVWNPSNHRGLVRTVRSCAHVLTAGDMAMEMGPAASGSQGPHALEEQASR